jgi:hypothetical protein
MAANTQYSAIADEQEAFNSMLDELLLEHAGHFVVFKGGKPVAFFPTLEDAHKAALSQFGLDGNFLVAEVRKYLPLATTRFIYDGIGGTLQLNFDAKILEAIPIVSA